MCENVTMRALEGMTAAAPAGAAAASLLGTGFQMAAGLGQGDAEAQAQRMNARLARWQAQDVLNRGVDEVAGIEAEGRRVASAANIAEATSGVSLATNPFAGSAMAVARDAAIAKANAAREAWGLKAEAAGFEARARAAKRNSVLGAMGTGLSGIGNAIDAFKSTKRPA